MHKRLRDLREDRDWSQRELAVKLNVAQTTYSDYELGKLNIPIEVLVKLAEIYNTSIDYLLEITDNHIPYDRQKACK